MRFAGEENYLFIDIRGIEEQGILGQRKTIEYGKVKLYGFPYRSNGQKRRYIIKISLLQIVMFKN
jgi:hypothetical protein